MRPRPFSRFQRPSLAGPVRECACGFGLHVSWHSSPSKANQCSEYSQCSQRSKTLVRSWEPLGYDWRLAWRKKFARLGVLDSSVPHLEHPGSHGCGQSSLLRSTCLGTAAAANCSLPSCSLVGDTASVGSGAGGLPSARYSFEEEVVHKDGPLTCRWLWLPASFCLLPLSVCLLSFAAAAAGDGGRGPF